MLDKVLQLVAIGQTIVTTIRAGSRAFYILKDGEIGIMEGPLILPPVVNETSHLFDVSESFREAVALGIEGGIMGQLKSMKDGEEDAAEYSELTDTTYDQEILDDDTIEDFIRNVTQAKPKPPSWAEKLGQVRRSISIPFRRMRAIGSSLPIQAFEFGTKFLHSDNDTDEHIDLEEGSEEFSSTVSRELVLERDSENIPARVVDIRAYAPSAFQKLRSRFGLTEGEFLKSVLGSGPFVSFQSNSKGAARSGGVFFFTRDGNYMIKTIKHAEVHALISMLPLYFRFMRRNGRRSLLTRICGMYEAKFSDTGQRCTFIVTNSVFPAASSAILNERYDLKGSTLGRECSEAERMSKGSGAVLKDLDLVKEVDLVKSHQKELDQQREGYGLNVGPVSKAALLTQLRKDVKLLVECGVIDYSMLVGVADIDTGVYQEDEILAIGATLEGETQVHLSRRGRLVDELVTTTLKPIRILLAPPLYLYRKSWSVMRKSLFWPLPYYGSGICGVNAGTLSRLYGKRRGRKVLYYLGVIDFLQPFNFQKKTEWKIKAIIHGEGFSCVPPEEYADRFLKFLEANLS